MPKYLLEASYTADGVKGLLKDGGSKRQAAIRAAIESVGGKLESMYFAFGNADALVIADLPDNATAASVSLSVANTGFVTTKTIVLLTPQEIDQAVKKSPSYTPPGR